MSTHAPQARPVDSVDLLPGAHVCRAVSSSQERDGLVARWTQHGLDAGERVFCIQAPGRRVALAQRLRELGVDSDGVVASGRLVVATPETAHLTDGVFATERAIAAHARFVEQSLAEGYPAVRMLVEAADALHVLPDRKSVLEYEAAIEDLCAAHSLTVLCVYDTRVFGADLAPFASRHPRGVADLQLWAFAEPGRVGLVGELDGSNAALLGALLGEQKTGDVTVDMEGLSFVDVAGTAELVRLARRVAPENRVLVQSPPRQLRTVLAAVGWEHELTLDTGGPQE